MRSMWSYHSLGRTFTASTEADPDIPILKQAKVEYAKLE